MRGSVGELDDDLGFWKVLENSILHGELYVGVSLGLFNHKGLPTLYKSVSRILNGSSTSLELTLRLLDMAVWDGWIRGAGPVQGFQAE
jgi:hypothetical protein